MTLENIDIFAGERRGRDGSPGLEFQFGQIEVGQGGEVGEIDRAARWDRCPAASTSTPLMMNRAWRGTWIGPAPAARRGPSAAACSSCSTSLQQIVGVFGVHLDVGVAGDAKGGVFDHVHPRKQQRQVAADDLLEWDKMHLVVSGTQRGRFSGTLMRTKSVSLRRRGVSRITPMELLRFEMNGNGWAGSTASGVRIGKTFLAEELVGGGPVEGLQGVVIADDDALLLPGRA